MLSSQSQVGDSVFELTHVEIDELPFGVVTLDRHGTILRYNRVEQVLSGRANTATIGLRFFIDVAPCTNVQGFRGRFDDFARHRDSGVEHFDFAFIFRWGRQDVSITMLRRAGHDAINILVRGHAMVAIGDAMVRDRRRPGGARHAQYRARDEHASPVSVAPGLAAPVLFALGGVAEAAFRDRIHVDDAPRVVASVAAAARARTAYCVEYRITAPDGGVSIVQECGSFDGATGMAPVAATLDVTTRRRSEDENWRGARYDALTGLPNRRTFLQRTADALREAETDERIAAVVVANIDKYREVNAMFGHPLGDRLIQELALRLGVCVRSGDTVARLTGDSFAILLTDVDTASSVEASLDRLVADVARPFIVDGRPYYLTLSFGISVGPYDSPDAESLLRAADTAMCAAKADSRNRCLWYSKGMAVDAALNARRHAELQAALENSELELHYQPIVDIDTDRIVAVESLVRWNHPTQGFLPPAQFIGLADGTGLIVPLGEWVLRAACRQAHRWLSMGLDLRVCVNVSPVQFRQPNFVALVEKVLADTGLPPQRLELELTEGVMVEGFDEMMRTLGRLKALRVRLAIDDFGTGYSSLAYVKYFPVDTLKIDRAFVNDIVTDPFDRAIATTVMTLANELKLDCIVEGVETAGQRDALRAIGCTTMQGYLFSRPLTAAKLEPLLGQAVSALTSPAVLG